MEKPVINIKSTNELMEIIKSPEQWQVEVYQEAEKELIKRGVSSGDQTLARETSTRNQKRLKILKGKATYTVIEKISITLLGPLALVLFDDFFFYKGEGYRRLNKQGLFYLLIGIFLWTTILYLNFK